MSRLAWRICEKGPGLWDGVEPILTVKSKLNPEGWCLIQFWPGFLRHRGLSRQNCLQLGRFYHRKFPCTISKLPINSAELATCANSWVIPPTREREYLDEEVSANGLVDVRRVAMNKRVSLGNYLCQKPRLCSRHFLMQENWVGVCLPVQTWSNHPVGQNKIYL
jgi:hypothetical protein